MVAEMTALTAAVAMATVIVEPKKRCMKVSFCSEVCFLNGSCSTPTKIRVVVFVAGLDLVPAQRRGLCATNSDAGMSRRSRQWSTTAEGDRFRTQLAISQ